MAQTQGTKRYRKSRYLWYRDYKPVTDKSRNGNPTEVVDFVNTSVGNMRYHVYSPSLNIRQDLVAPKTLKAILNSGHQDIEAWAYANPWEPKVYKCGDKFFRTTLVPNTQTRNWVLDLDQGCDFHSILDVEVYFRNNSSILPYCIIQTGPEHFHVVFVGKTGEWSYDEILRFVKRVFSISSYYGDVDAMLKHRGVDPNYLAQNIERAKFRLPGTPNNHHIIDGKPFICKIWFNPDFQAGQDVSNLQTIKKIFLNNKNEPKKEIINKTTELSKIEEQLLKELKEIFGQRLALTWAKFIAKHTGFLKAGKCTISQLKIAQEFNIAQPSVSRQLRKMLKMGFLKTDHYYVKEKLAKVYMAGDKLMKIIDPKLKLVNNYSVLDPYVRGETNEHYLRDIRMLYLLGANRDSIVEICYKKMMERPKIKRRSKREISKTVDKWFEIAKVEAPGRPLVDLKRICSLLEIDNVT